MRRASLLVLSLLLLTPEICSAFSENSVSGTYTFTLQATTTDPAKICNGARTCGGTDNVSGSIGFFYKKFAADLKSNKCSSASASLRSSASKIATAGPRAGDTFYAVGTLIADGTGDFTDGAATFNSTSTSGELVNFSDAGTPAIVCGGQDKSGQCAILCPGSLKCSSGGYGVTGNGGTATLYAFPQLLAGQCGPGITTADECCNDPALVIVVHMTFTLGNLNAGVADKIRGVITDQGAAGVVDATIQ